MYACNEHNVKASSGIPRMRLLSFARAQLLVAPPWPTSRASIQCLEAFGSSSFPTFPSFSPPLSFTVGLRPLPSPRPTSSNSTDIFHRTPVHCLSQHQPRSACDTANIDICNVYAPYSFERPVAQPMVHVTRRGASRVATRVLQEPVSAEQVRCTTHNSIIHHATSHSCTVRMCSRPQLQQGCPSITTVPCAFSPPTHRYVVCF